ncbi:hypothetical protein QR680_012650 [Steinernema hermaphroditum]|uniref:BED-type domain-containing protein n=1 Tax=Steinernema hermaphroditum TaxID=289476 RepID=A0AA39I4A9_9BILA|nr:hypothetical protein QR680_012650 [Steinernema hermaphroditum]
MREAHQEIPNGFDDNEQTPTSCFSDESVLIVTQDSRGPKRSADVWQFFDEVHAKGSHRSSCRLCKKSFCDAPTTLKRHIMRNHAELWTTRKRKKAQSGDETDRTASDKKDRQEEAVKALTDLFANSVIPVGLVNNSDFRQFLSSVNPRFQVPCTETVKHYLNERYVQGKKRLDVEMEKSEGISITTDLWTVKGYTRSFIALTGHFVSKKDAKIISALLDIAPMVENHTAEHIRTVVEKVLLDYGLHVNQLEAVLTDNGRNIVKAFELLEGDAMAKEDETSEDNTEPVYDDIEPDDVVLDGDDFRFEDPDDDETDLWTRSEVPTRKRISCVIHSLQLVLKRATESFDKRRRLQKVLNFVKLFRMSSKTARDLYIRTKLTLKLPCTTRWNSIFYVFGRLLEVKDAVQEVSLLHNHAPLSEEDFKFVMLVHKALEPFENFTKIMEKGNEISISKVMPFLKDQLITLESSSSDVNSLEHMLASALRFRFKICLNEADYKHRYTLASYLDPNYHVFLTPSEIISAEQLLLQKILQVPAFCRTLFVAQKRHRPAAKILSPRELALEEMERHRNEQLCRSYSMIHTIDYCDSSIECNVGKNFLIFYHTVRRKKKPLIRRDDKDTVYNQTLRKPKICITIACHSLFDKVMEQARQAKESTQKDLATGVNEKPQVVPEYENNGEISDSKHSRGRFNIALDSGGYSVICDTLFGFYRVLYSC